MRRVARVWALVGVAALLGTATARLGARGWATIVAGLTPVEWLALTGLCVVMMCWEGIAVLRRRWVPRVAARAAEVDGEDSALLRLAAPLYGMSLIGAPRAHIQRRVPLVDEAVEGATPPCDPRSDRRAGVG